MSDNDSVNAPGGVRKYSRPVDLVDQVLALAAQAADADEARRLILLAEIDARLAAAGDEPGLALIRFEVQRMIGASS